MLRNTGKRDTSHITCISRIEHVEEHSLEWGMSHITCIYEIYSVDISQIEHMSIYIDIDIDICVHPLSGSYQTLALEKNVRQNVIPQVKLSDWTVLIIGLNNSLLLTPLLLSVPWACDEMPSLVMTALRGCGGLHFSTACESPHTRSERHLSREGQARKNSPCDPCLWCSCGAGGGVLAAESDQDASCEETLSGFDFKSAPAKFSTVKQRKK